MILVQQRGDIYNIKFSYNQEVVELVKNVPGRRWVPEMKLWTIPKDKLGFLIAQFKGTKYEDELKIESQEYLYQNAELSSTSNIPKDIDLSDVNFRIAEGSTPFEHQWDTFRYYKSRYASGQRNGFLLADEPGAGKTLQITNLAIYKKETQMSQHCLIIVCVNSAKYNWRDDILKHTRGEFQPYILGTRKKRNGQLRYSTGGEEKLADLISGKTFGGKHKDSTDLPFFLILNIEAVRYKKGKNYLIAEELIRRINEGYIDMVAIDEIHKNASPSSLQGSQLLKIKKSIARKIEWFPMTGTPIVSKPTDVFLALRLIDGHYGNSFWSWCQQFCVYGGFGGHEIIGYKNIPYLKSLLEPNMLRRLKKDILDLPEKMPQTIYIENTEYQQKLYNELEMALCASRDSVVKSLNPLTHFLRLRQVNGSPELIDPDLPLDNNYIKKNAKLAVLLEMIEDIMENTDEKIIVFSNWVEPLRTLYRFITKRYKVCTYTGTMSSDDREEHKQRFINDPTCRIIIGTYGALGTSHTLTVANHVFFYDEHWNPAEMKQAEDRVHRPGQNNTVNLYQMITVDTVDERVHNLLYTKEGISEYIVDGTLDIHNHPEIFDLLLSKK